MNSVIQAQIHDEADRILHSANAHGKGKIPIILPPEIVAQTGLFSFGQETSQGEGKL